MKLNFSDVIKKWDIVRTQKVEALLVDFATRMDVTTLGKIDKFEYRSGIILPLEYKEFCLIFGSGIFGITHFSIKCLPNEIDSNATVEEILEYRKELLNSYKKDCQWSSKEIDILDSGLVFGSGYDKSSTFIFDLRTYSEQDLSYDIYGVYREDICASTGIIYPLGRSFLNFIENICAGDEAQTNCQQMLPPIPDYFDDDEDEGEPQYYKRRTFIVSGGIGENFEDKRCEG